MRQFFCDISPRHSAFISCFARGAFADDAGAEVVEPERGSHQDDLRCARSGAGAGQECSVFRPNGDHASERPIARARENMAGFQRKSPNGACSESTGRTVVYIDDPVAQVSYVLDPQTHIAHRVAKTVIPYGSEPDFGGSEIRQNCNSPTVDHLLTEIFPASVRLGRGRRPFVPSAPTRTTISRFSLRERSGSPSNTI